VGFLEGVEIEERDEVLEEKLGKGKKRKRKEDGKDRKKGLCRWGEEHSCGYLYYTYDSYMFVY
jgi:hypothetical protein